MGSALLNARSARGAARIVPEVGRLEAFRETPALLDNATAVLRRHADRLGGVFVYWLGGMTKVLIVTDPAILRHVLKDNHENYPKSSIQIRRMGQFLGPGLLTDHGATWLRKRRLLQQAFNPSRLAAMAADMQVSLDETLARFDAAIRRGPVEVGAQMTRITLCMVTRSLFSAKLPESDVEVISSGIGAVQAFMVRQIVKPHLRPWFALSGSVRRHQKIRGEGDAILQRLIDERRAAAETLDDLLGILMDAGFGPDGAAISDQEILDESLQFLVAGHETSSNALSWTFYLLSRDPAALEAVRGELETVVGEEPLQFDDLARLPATIATIEEALRLFPPFWMVDRMALEDDEAAGVAIPAGAIVVAFIHGTHHAQDFWPEPDRFRPDRFVGADKGLRNSLHYLPFGAGPKRCIGSGYAMLQMVMILNALLRRYRFGLATEAPVRPRAMIIQQPRDGLWMRFERL
jgi:cytochrome P450